MDSLPIQAPAKNLRRCGLIDVKIIFDRTCHEPEADSHLDLKRRRTFLADREANSYDLKPIDIMHVGLTVFSALPTYALVGQV